MEKMGYEEVCAEAGNNAALIKGHGSRQGDPVIVVIYRPQSHSSGSMKHCPLSAVETSTKYLEVHRKALGPEVHPLVSGTVTLFQKTQMVGKTGGRPRSMYISYTLSISGCQDHWLRLGTYLWLNLPPCN